MTSGTAEKRVPEHLAGPRPKVWLALRPSSKRGDLVIGKTRFP